MLKKNHFVYIVSHNSIKITLPYAVIWGVMNIPMCVYFYSNDEQQQIGKKHIGSLIICAYQFYVTFFSPSTGIQLSFVDILIYRDNRRIH